MISEREFDAIEATSSYLNRPRRSITEIDTIIYPEPGSVLELLERARSILND